MTTKTVTVRIDTRTVGQCFATVGQLISVRTGRVLAETQEVPYGFLGSAMDRARALAEKRGYRISIDE